MKSLGGSGVRRASPTDRTEIRSRDTGRREDSDGYVVELQAFGFQECFQALFGHRAQGPAGKANSYPALLIREIDPLDLEIGLLDHLGAVFGVGDVVANEGLFARKVAFARHDSTPLRSKIYEKQSSGCSGKKNPVAENGSRVRARTATADSDSEKTRSQGSVERGRRPAFGAAPIEAGRKLEKTGGLL